jgi:hypothetical protein
MPIRQQYADSGICGLLLAERAGRSVECPQAVRNATHLLNTLLRQADNWTQSMKLYAQSPLGNRLKPILGISVACIPPDILSGLMTMSSVLPRR